MPSTALKAVPQSPTICRRICLLRQRERNRKHDRHLLPASEIAIVTAVDGALIPVPVKHGLKVVPLKAGPQRGAPKVGLPKDAVIRATVVQNVVPIVEAVANAAAVVMIAAMMPVDVHLATKAHRVVALAKV